MSNELSEEQIEKIWNLNRASTHVRWNELRHAEKEAAYASMLHGAYYLGRESVQTERTGWTDDELEDAILGMAPIVILSQVDLRRILTHLGIDHEPPVKPPEPGTRHITMNGDLAFVDAHGRLRIVEEDGSVTIIMERRRWPHLTPARFVEDGEA